MSATTFLRRAATVLTATAIAVPSFAGLSGAAWAAGPAGHGKAATSHGKSAHSHAAKPARRADTKKPARHVGHAGHAGHVGHAARHAEPKPAAVAHQRPARATKHHDATDHNPRGNNGTVFIHDVAGDNRPHNVPHVGCTFYVDFFGFDSEQVLSTTFVGQAPTGAGTPLPSGDWTGSMPANGARGAGRDFDAEQAFTLDVTVLGAPQAQQGYHVKLTVATGEPGGVKHKVFWVSGCEQSAPVGAAAVEQASPSVVPGLRAERATSATPQVLGLTVTRALPAGATRVVAVSAARTPTSLPFTGAPVGLLLAVAGVGLGAGGALLVAGRRRTSTAD